MRRSIGVVVVGLAAALAPVARAQDEAELERRAISVEQGREAVWRFLTQGEAAPRPDLTRAELERARTDVSETCDFLGGVGRSFDLRGCDLTVAPDGTVHQYSAGGSVVRELAPDGSRRTEEDIAAEVAERTHLDEAALRARALAFLRGRYPDFARRVFEEREVMRFTNELRQIFVLYEAPASGQLAVYHNSIAIELSPETGAVVRYYASNVRVVVTEPPPLDEAAAVARAREERKRPEQTTVKYVSLGFLFCDGAPRAVWSFTFTDAEGNDIDAYETIHIDAHDGRRRVRDRL